MEKKDNFTFKDKALMSWELFKPLLIKHLKGEAVTYALKQLIGTAWATGFRGWLVKYIVEHFFDEIAEPLIKLTMRKGELIYDQQKGKIQIKRLKDAKTVDDYSDKLDNILQ